MNDIIFQLSRPSQWKDEAFKAGLIRPFLLMVSMNRNFRLAISEILGVSLKDTTDPHEEAWTLLHHSRNGMVRLAAHSYEKLLLQQHRINWYECAYR
jgi:hypothetical protein